MKKSILAFLILILILILSFNFAFADGNRWTSKPPVGSQINWGHPLAKGLVGVWLMNEGGGKPKELISRNSPTVNGTPTWKPQGIYLNNSSWLVYSASYIPTLSKYSVCIFGDFDAFSSWDSYGSMFVRESTAGNSQVAIYRSSSSSFLSVSHDNIAASNLSNLGNFPGKNNFVVITFFNNTVRSYLNGILKDSNSFSTQPTAGTGDIKINGSRDASPLSGSGNYKFLFLYNRALSPSEISKLYENPYCFIKPPTVWSMFSTAVTAARRMFMAQ